MRRGAMLLSACLGCTSAQPDATTTLLVRVTDGLGGPELPARLILYDAGGLPVPIGRLDAINGTVQDRGYCELADGAVGTWQGIALWRGDAELPVGTPVCDDDVPIRYGRYRARIVRGAEYQPFDTFVDL